MSARNMAKRTAAGTLALAVCLGGGALALAGAAQADANFKFDTRIAGDDRYATAIAASKAAFPDGTKTDNVVLVNGFATVDGLTASYLAGVANAPILYVSDKGADDATKAEIKRLGAKNVWLVGGTTVIPTSVEAAIKGDGYTVTRINGSDRYETAKLIAAKGTELAGKKPAKVFVASGTSFADALAVSPIAYAKGYAIALTEKDSTSQFTKDELGAIGTDNKILVGGEAVVSKKVQADLSISDAQRVAGADRAVTANLVSDWAKSSEGFNKANAALVGGTNGNGADSLVASSLGGKSFTTLHFAGWDATYTYLKDHSAELTGKGFVFGGKAAVSDDSVSKAQAAAQYVAPVTSLTSAPELVGVKVADVDGDKTAVRFTFDEDISATVGAVSKFVLVDSVGGTTAADTGSVKKDKANPNSVTAIYDTAKVKVATSAYTLGGAVTDLDAKSSPVGSAGFQAITVQGTDAADLVKVGNAKNLGTADATVDLVFDDTVVAPPVVGSTIANAFTFTKANGEALAGINFDQTTTTREKTTKDNDTYRVKMANLTQTQYDALRRVAVLGGVSGANQKLQNADIVSGGATDGPDIAKVDINRDKDWVDVTFDTPVTVTVTTAGTLVLTENDHGTVASLATPALVSGSNTTVRFSFAANALATGDDLTAFTTIKAGTVTAASNALVNQVDGEGYSYTYKAGETAGPDLQAAVTSVSTGAFSRTAITLTFDETVTTKPLLSELTGYKADGSAVTLTADSTEIVQKDGKNTNQVRFLYTTAGAVKTGVEDGDFKSIALDGATTLRDAHGYGSYMVSAPLK